MIISNHVIQYGWTSIFEYSSKDASILTRCEYSGKEVSIPARCEYFSKMRVFQQRREYFSKMRVFQQDVSIPAKTRVFQQDASILAKTHPYGNPTDEAAFSAAPGSGRNQQGGIKTLFYNSRGIQNICFIIQVFLLKGYSGK